MSQQRKALRGNDEWRTPTDLIHFARQVMGGIDLDPATAPDNPTGAKRFHTVDDDGLRQPWRGRVWLNPPYSRDGIAAFTRKALDEAPHVDAMMILVNASTETRWFQSLIRHAARLLLLDRRVSFVDAAGVAHRDNPSGQALFLFTRDPDTLRRFDALGAERGSVMTTIHTQEATR